MTPILSNKQVERILSLIIILYGLWTIILSAGDLLQSLIRKSMLQGRWDSNSLDWLYYSVNVAVGLLLIGFFPQVVQWIGYFATKEKVRSKRQWLPRDTLAVPLVLYAFTEFLYVALVGESLVEYAVRSWDSWGDKSWYLLGCSPILLFYTAFGVMILMNARSIAAWLLKYSTTTPSKTDSLRG